MASPGLLFLLMVSSSLLLSGLSAPSSSKQLQTHALHKRANEKRDLVTAADKSAKFLSAVAPFMSIIPVHGSLISAILSLVSAVLGQAGGMGPDETRAFIKSQFENLNFKIDQYHKIQKWNTWASKYATYETYIETKWKKFKELVEVLGKGEITEVSKKKIEEFKLHYKPDTIDKFAYDLTKENAVFITDFEKLISEHVNCHEEDVKEITQAINTLINHGVTMSHFHYKLNENNNEVDNLADKAYEVSSTMFQIHKKCIINSMKFVEDEVRNLIDESNKQKSQQAKTIRVFLEKAYGRYDWTVVVFNTKNKFGQKSHYLSGFTEVKKDKLTAAVARQVKGKHTKVRSISEDIKNCVKNTRLCVDVIQKLKACKAITDHSLAFHVFDAKSNRHDSISETPNFYEGKCGLPPKGGFIVFIRSDEEIEKKDPCSTKECGDKTKGKCVVLDTVIPVCECEKSYYGENCEKSLDEYKKNMNEKMPKTQSTKRRNSAP